MPMRRPQRSTRELVTLIVMAWSLMAAGLAILPALAANVVSEPWPIVIAWGLVSIAWMPVEVVLRSRMGAVARFFVTVPLWLAAAVCGFWLRHALGV